MKIFIQVVNSRVEGYGSTKGNDNDIEIEVSDNHEVLSNPYSFKYIDNQLVKDSSFILDKQKDKKYKELDYICTETILGRFNSTINGVEYEFSYDAEAQSRFSGVANSFTRGYITEIEWTAYLNGERTSVILSESLFDLVAKDALYHESSNISKFRQKVKEINVASTVDQVKAISW